MSSIHWVSRIGKRKGAHEETLVCAASLWCETVASKAIPERASALAIGRETARREERLGIQSGDAPADL